MSGENEPVLVTGASGFLGSWIMARLIAEGRPVIAADLTDDRHRLDQLVPRQGQGRVQWQICDIADTKAVSALVAETKPDAIIHLAALQIPACRAAPPTGALINVVGHANVMEAAREHDVGKVIYTSSVAAKPRGPANAPGNLYGVFKKTDEEISRLYAQDFGVTSLGVRPYIVYGIGRDDGETSAITKAIRAAALGEAYDMPFSTTSCLQYAGEMAEIFHRCVEADWEGAVLSDLTVETDSTDDLIAAIRAEIPDAQITRSDVDRVSPTDGFDNEPLKAIVGEWPRTSLADGVRDTIARYRALGK